MVHGASRGWLSIRGMAVEQLYRYAHPSRLSADRLEMATCDRDAAAHPHFFDGALARPERTAKMLLGLMSIVQARFHIPAAALEAMSALWDPVVTSSDNRRRFEGFSGCCGAYARVDLHPDALRGETFGRGTTNVDFNQPMLSALAGVRAGDDVGLSVGAEGVTLASGGDGVVEKKVELPLRWLKGFVEVQACQRRMQRVVETSGPSAVRWLKSLPRMKTNRRATWIVASGKGMRTTQVRPRGAAARVGGLERLRVLERLASRARALHVYADDTTGATGWVLVFDDCRFQLLLSPEVWRGFSGEGQALDALAGDYESALSRVRAQLKWHAVIDASELARRAEVGERMASDALAALGARGLVGFDLDADAYFHRELPFDVSAVEELQPRLRSARKLVDADAVRVHHRDDVIEGFVQSGDVEHRVRIAPEETRCTCPWFAKHKQSRGPCKHVLALQLVLEEKLGDR